MTSWEELRHVFVEGFALASPKLRPRLRPQTQQNVRIVICKFSVVFDWLIRSCDPCYGEYLYIRAHKAQGGVSILINLGQYTLYSLAWTLFISAIVQVLSLLSLYSDYTGTFI